ncbi:YitT family protein [Mycoplasma phocoenae]|uniref:DUF2179 domain-containing protein n=1 Tax=Mycoplasma phocoenae TaxID=754517 RepID=A0A858U127_9MOLU|nr:YitT family protein [Mycoplasma phocoenae]QJG66804.1 DUF2179 domain-containing protein [Mycoplasma phocoenae]
MKPKKLSRKAKVIDLTDINRYNLNCLNIWVKQPKKLFWMFVSAFIFNFGIATFLVKAGTVASGTSSLIQLITYSVEVVRKYFAVLYLLINLPFVIWFWKKNNRQFMLLTLYWLLFQIVSEFFFNGINSNQPYIIRDWLKNDFSIYYIKYSLNGQKEAWTLYPSGTWNGLSNLSINTEVVGKWENWTLIEDVVENGQIKYAKGLSGWVEFAKINPSMNIIQSDVPNLSGTWNGLSNLSINTKVVGKWENWTLIEDIVENGQIKYAKGLRGWTSFAKINPYMNVSKATWPIVIYTLLGGILGGLSAAIAWKHGGSTAGSDVFIYYISKIKKASVGRVGFFISCCFAGFSIINIGILECTGLVNDHPWDMSLFIVRAMSTIVYITVYNLIISLIYPKYKKIRIEIHTQKIDEVSQHLKAINYWHSWNIIDKESGYSGDRGRKIETIALFLEQNEIIKEVKKIDPNAWINILPTLNIHGNFNTQKID